MMDTNKQSSALPGTEASEWQTCPVCHGLGVIYDYRSTSTFSIKLPNPRVFNCPSCDGKRRIKI